MLNECSQNCEKFFDSVSHYLLFIKGCAVHWVTRLEGRWDRSVIVASGLWAAWPRNCGSNSGMGTNFCGVHNIEGASEVLPASSSCGTWGEVAGAVRQPHFVCLVLRWTCGPILPPPPYGFMAWCWIKHRDGWTAILYIKCCQVSELVPQCSCFWFSYCAVCLIVSLQAAYFILLQVDLILMRRHHLINNFGCDGGWADNGAWLWITCSDQDSPLALKLFSDSLCI